MRTNIEIDDELMAKAMLASGQNTKKAAVETALQLMVRLGDQRLAIGELRELGPWQGDLESSRVDGGEG
jgi:Arc/MetJ family transcription regulator